VTDNVVIKATQHADVEQLTKLHAASFGDAAWSLQQIQDSLKLETTQGFTAKMENEIVGFILFQQTDDQSEILTFCVHPKRQRQKIGQALLQEAIKASANKNLFLEVAADNAPACNLYAKCGFQLIGKRPGYYKRGTAQIDALTFRLRPFASVP
jgi:ribosomal-protein-alanine N-acetyltransferase